MTGSTGAALKFAFDGWRDAPLLLRDEHPELMCRRRIVAAIAPIGDDALDRGADLRLHLGNDDAERVAVIGVSR